MPGMITHNIVSNKFPGFNRVSIFLVGLFFFIATASATYAGFVWYDFISLRAGIGKNSVTGNVAKWCPKVVYQGKNVKSWKVQVTMNSSTNYTVFKDGAQKAYVTARNTDQAGDLVKWFCAELTKISV